ncbi:MAG: hypothetical protein ABF296_05085, partial [Oceanococcaceae bacterium]
ARKQLDGPRTDQARDQARRDQLQRQHAGIEQRQAAMRAEHAQRENQPPQDDLQALGAAALAAADALERGQVQADAAADALKQARADVDVGERQARDASAALAKARARFSVLQAEQERSLGQDERAGRRELEKRGVTLGPALGEILKVPAGREVAVEAVLGTWLRAPLVEPLGVPALPAGFCGLGGGPVPATESLEEDALGFAVVAPRAVHDWLRPFRFVAEHAAAVELAHQHAQPCVTARGEIVWPDAQRGATGADDTAGVLLRQQQLEAAQQDFANAQAAADTAEKVRADARMRLQQAEQAWSQAGQALDVLRQQRAQADEQRTQAETRRERYERQRADAERALQHMHDEQQQLAREISALDVAIAQRQQTLAELADKSQQADMHWREVQADAGQVQQSGQQLRRQLQQLREQRDEWSRRRAAAESRVASRQQGLSQIELGMTRARTALQQLPQDDALSQQLAAATEAYAECETRRTQAQAQVSEAGALRTRAQQALDQSRQQNEAALQEVQELRLERERLRSRQDALVEQMEEHGLSPHSAVDAVTDAQTLAGVQEALEGLERKLARLGPVNLAAVEEYEEESRRAEDLRRQNADLSDALEQLESAMAQIDRETRALFRQTFNAVNAGFQVRFPKLFGGGEAGLELIGDDVLSAGVRVMARPPGKRNASIALLSGGEKALTAVALVFALFELNPAPFCMLDEVDAPLDDANVVRFCEVVKEMSAQVQFIVVTHNKVTMEMADALHGVTMQEAGVSRLVGVDVSAAVAMTEEPA